MTNVWFFIALLVVLLAEGGRAQQAGPVRGTGPLESRLLEEDPAALARAARELGDPQRGAILFYQPALSCVKCHAQGNPRDAIGPDLTERAGRPNDSHAAGMTGRHSLGTW